MRKIVSLLFVLSIGCLVFLNLQKVVVKTTTSQAKHLSEYANNILEICLNNSNWRDCYGKQLAQFNYQSTLPKTLEILHQLQKLDDKTRDCHLISHFIATSEVEKSPEDWINVFDYVDQTTCNNGFVHGVLEGRNRTDPHLELNSQTIVETCKQIDSKTAARLGIKESGSDDACGHIIGHIVLAQEEARIPEAVNICNSLPENLKVSCLQGIFMENITRENLEIHEVAKKIPFTEATAEEIGQMCTRLGGEIGKNCWRELAHLFTSLARNDPQKSYEYCYQNRDQDYALECYLHAINLIVLSPNYSQEDLKNTCKNYFQTDSLNPCMGRTIGSLLNSSLDFLDRALDFCKNIPASNQNRCYGTIGELIKKRIAPDKRAEICKVIPEQYLSYCL